MTMLCNFHAKFTILGGNVTTKAQFLQVVHHIFSYMVTFFAFMFLLDNLSAFCLSICLRICSVFYTLSIALNIR